MKQASEYELEQVGAHTKFFLCFKMLIRNILFLGASGLGKSTLINTLFKTRAARTSCTTENSVIPKTVEIKSVTHGI